MYPNRTLIYLIGEPGVGKSTAMRKATDGLTRYPQTRPLKHDILADGPAIVAAELGARRGTFSGTDALPMNAVIAAEHFLASPGAPDIILAEGARLANQRFLTAAVDTGYDVHLLHLSNPNAAMQREERGTHQNESWVKGAKTRADNLADTHIPGVTVHWIDMAQQDAAAYIREMIAYAIKDHGIVTALTGGNHG